MNLKKLFCRHKFEHFGQIYLSIFYHREAELYICRKCGKVKLAPIK